MKGRSTIIAIILLSLVSIVLQFAQAEDASLNTENTSLNLKAPSNETELISFVESAVAHVKEVGKERAIKDFMDINGSWVRGDVYIFAHAFNGTTLVLPYQPSAVGTNRLDVQDPQGRYVNREMNCIAQHGNGFYHYVYRNPVSNKIENKVSYVTKVDDNWWLGAGIYKNASF